MPVLTIDESSLLILVSGVAMSLGADSTRKPNKSRVVPLGLRDPIIENTCPNPRVGTIGSRSRHVFDSPWTNKFALWS